MKEKNIIENNTREEVYNTLRQKLNISREAFSESETVLGLVTEELKQSYGKNLQEREQLILMRKIALFHRGNGIADAVIIAKTIIDTPDLLLSNGFPNLKTALDIAKNSQKKSANQVWQGISNETRDMPTIAEVSLGNGSHYLGRIFTKNQIAENGATLNTCIQGKSLERYFDKSVSGTIEIFSVFTSNSHTPITTIVYDSGLGEIMQVKKQDDRLLDGAEPFFDVVMESIHHLVSEPSYRTDGSPYSRTVKYIRDMEDLSPEHPIAIDTSGEIRPLDEMIYTSPEAILGGSKIKVHSDINIQKMIELTESAPVAIDMTEATNEQRKSLRKVLGTLVDDRSSVSGYDSLESVGGQILANNASAASFKNLSHVRRGLYAKKAKEVSIPLLQTVLGRIDVPMAETLYAPELTFAGGNIDASSVQELIFSKLQKVGWDIRAHNASRVEMPLVEEIGGEFQVEQALEIFAPLLRVCRGIKTTPQSKITVPDAILVFRDSGNDAQEKLSKLQEQDQILQEKNAEIKTKIEVVLHEWQQQLPEVKIILDGSLVSGLHIIDQDTKVIDADVRILSDMPITDELQKKITSITGLIYRKTHDIDIWPDGEKLGKGIMLAEAMKILGINLPVEVCAMLRSSAQYINWGQYYRQVLTENEIFSYTKQKRLLQSGSDEKEYKKFKKKYLDLVRKRCAERGLVELPNYVLPEVPN